MPGEDSLDAVVGVIDPLLRKLERSLKKTLPTLGTVWTAEGSVMSFQLHGTVGAPRVKPAPVVGEIRLCFQRTKSARHITFSAEAVYSKSVSPSTGFSGFSVAGEVREIDGKQVASADAWTIRYGVWRFLNPLLRRDGATSRRGET